MKLKNNFSQETRNLFIDVEYLCFLCGGNGQDSGGMELHHILGRESNSPYNASPLCKECHKIADNKGVSSLNETQIKLLRKTEFHLGVMNYKPKEEDIVFLEKWKNQISK